MFESRGGGPALAETRTKDLATLSDHELQDGFAELQRAAAALEAERLRWLAEIERRGTFKEDGHLSASAWLASRFRLAFPSAAQQVRTARALEEMPQTRDAMASGALSTSAVSVLVSAREASPEQFSEAEALLVQAGCSLPPRDLRQTVERWRDAVDAGAGEHEATRLRERRRLDVSSAPSGMVRIDGDLDPESGQTLITALQAVMDADARTLDPDDGRRPTQRRADALYEVTRQWLNRSDRPQVAGERPHVNVLVDMEVLERRSGGHAELDDAGSVHSEIARMLACDSSVSRVVVKGRPNPSMSAGGLPWSLPRFAERWSSETSGADSRDATVPPGGATPTM